MKRVVVSDIPDSSDGSVDVTNELSRRLGLTSAIMVVIGSVVGSGIFLTPSNVAAAVQVPGVMMFVWVFTGLLTLAGALTNAEIASEITDVGGHMYSSAFSTTILLHFSMDGRRLSFIKPDRSQLLQSHLLSTLVSSSIFLI